MGKANLVATSDRRIAQLVGIIGRDKARVDKIKRAVDRLDWKQQPSWWPPRPHNKRDKLIALNFGRAFGRLEKQLRRHDGGEVLVRALYGWEPPDFFEWQAQLTHWRECFEAFGGKSPAKRQSSLFEDEEGPTTWPLGRPKPSAPRLVHKHNAVAAAASILESHGLRLTATRKSSTRNASVFCRVSAVLAGDPRIYHQCRAFIKTRNRVLR
jgi:hypothetical protein